MPSAPRRRSRPASRRWARPSPRSGGCRRQPRETPRGPRRRRRRSDPRRTPGWCSWSRAPGSRCPAAGVAALWLVLVVLMISRVAPPPQPAIVVRQAASTAISADRRIAPHVSGARGRLAHSRGPARSPHFARKTGAGSGSDERTSGYDNRYIAATPNPRATNIRGAGDPVPWGESRGEPAGGAGSFSASPSANPAGPRKRVLRVPHLILPTLAALALASAPTASAAATAQGSGGGASAGPATATGTSATPSATSLGDLPGRERDLRRRRDRRDAGAPVPAADGPRHHGEDHPRSRVRARGCAAAGAAGDLGRRPDPAQALSRRRRPRCLERHARTTARARCRTCCTRRI